MNGFAGLSKKQIEDFSECLPDCTFDPGPDILGMYGRAYASLVPGGGLILCGVDGCGPVGWTLAAVGVIPATRVATLGATGIRDVAWVFGTFKSEAKWAGQLAKRGWTNGQITEAIKSGSRFPGENLVNKGNPATRYVHPETGQSVVIDNSTNEVLHVGGPGFKY
jgi:hypothetical protein